MRVRRKLSLGRKALMGLIGLMAFVLVVGIGGYLFALNITGKIKPIEYTGDPRVPEEEIAAALKVNPNIEDYFFTDPSSNETKAPGLFDDTEPEDDEPLFDPEETDTPEATEDPSGEDVTDTPEATEDPSGEDVTDTTDATDPEASATPGQTKNTRQTVKPTSIKSTTVKKPTATPKPKNKRPTLPPSPTPKPYVKDDFDIFERNLDQIEAKPLNQNASLINILLIGSDTRVLSEYGRSDTVMIMTVNTRTQKIHLTSLMRALYVSIPGHGRSLLNASLQWGGPSLLLKTIERNFRIKIDQYIYIDFSGFQKSVDTLGGINIGLNQKEVDYMKSTVGGEYVVGSNLLNGKQTLTYTRIRKIDSDFVRTSRQRTVITAMIVKARASGVTTISALVNQNITNVKSNIGSGDLLNLALKGGTTYIKYPISEMMVPLMSDTSRTYTPRGAEVWTYTTKSVNAMHSFINS